MMCCNNCPFNPKNCNKVPKCDNPICKNSDNNCYKSFCAKNIGTRCFMDYYVIDHLFQRDELAESLVFESLKTALIRRDRALLLSLFQAANNEIKIKMWNWLEENESRSLWMLNPIFAANGLAELTSFSNTGNKKSKYLEAVLSNKYNGRYFKTAYLM